MTPELSDEHVAAICGVLIDHGRGQFVIIAEQAEEELASRREQVARREEKAAVVEVRLRAWDESLGTREVELETRGRRVELTAKMAAQPNEAGSKVGRNERCPCGSGLKHKHVTAFRPVAGRAPR